MTAKEKIICPICHMPRYKADMTVFPITGTNRNRTPKICRQCANISLRKGLSYIPNKKDDKHEK